MASIIFGEVASSLGGALFGSVGQAVGLGMGRFFGRQFDNALLNKGSYHKEGNRISDLTIQTSTYGKNIPIIFGSAKLAGNIVWTSNMVENVNNYSSDLDIFGINQASYRSYNYKISLAIAIAEGEISEISRIWANGKLLPLQMLNFRFYKGTEDQKPDPLLEAIYGIGKTPAYRGIAYIVIENMQLDIFGNHIPNFVFEVKRKTMNKIGNEIPLEDKIESIVLIPGSGEFVYDTEIQKKIPVRAINNNLVKIGKETRLNENNNRSLADSVLSLNQLKEACPNLKWVAPVTCWFANSLDIKDCKILPGVEYHQGAITEPNMWKVGGFDRVSSYLISKDKTGNPTYGGTIADVSLIRYLNELKSRNYKIMFYPMFFMDLPNKPWRGRLTGKSSDVRDFFYKKGGYNEFILHYARLVVGKIDVFIIGSELIGLTKIREKNNFPAVECLIGLAAKVKEILGKEVKVSYAADWSEYHHTEGGYYNLDPLWASENIDFIGIDAYFPLTDLEEEQYDKEKIAKGWEEGEGWDYYFENGDKAKKRNLEAAYAWKNIKFWWENEHVNPGNVKSPWIPKSKKIWFTEFGFPSVDLCANQPNVFYDSKSIENGFPKKSVGAIDFLAQRTALTATLDKWKNSPMIEEKFIWCWDARPYPFWPDFDHIWSDGGCWSRGHWLNGKLGITSLGAIVMNLCSKIGINEHQIDVSELLDFVEGYVVDERTSVKEAIEELQKTYFFDVIEEEGKIKFIKRGKRKSYEIDLDEIIPIKNEDNNLINFKISRTDAENLPNEVKIICYNRAKNYEILVESALKPYNAYYKTISVATNQVFSSGKARIIAKTILDNFWEARNFYNFSLPVKYSYLNVGDLVEILDNDNKKILRIVNLNFVEKRKIEISAVVENTKIYHQNIFEDIKTKADSYSDPGDSNLYIIDIPKLRFEITNNPRLLLAADGFDVNWKGVKVKCPNNNIINIHKNTLGVIHSDIINDQLLVNITSGELFSYDNDEMGFKNLALIGKEIIKFQNAEMISNNIYKLSKISRGLYNSFKNPHLIGEKFILLDDSLKTLELPEIFIGKELVFEAISLGRTDANKQIFKHKFH